MRGKNITEWIPPSLRNETWATAQTLNVSGGLNSDHTAIDVRAYPKSGRAIETDGQLTVSNSEFESKGPSVIDGGGNVSIDTFLNNLSNTPPPVADFRVVEKTGWRGDRWYDFITSAQDSSLTTVDGAALCTSLFGGIVRYEFSVKKLDGTNAIGDLVGFADSRRLRGGYISLAFKTPGARDVMLTVWDEKDQATSITKRITFAV